MSSDKPISELFHEAAADWVDREAAASLLEDLKSSTLAQWVAELGDMPVNRAETQIKASERWVTLVEKIIDARKAANRAKVQLEYLRMKFQEWQNSEANARQEMKMVG